MLVRLTRPAVWQRGRGFKLAAIVFAALFAITFGTRFIPALRVPASTPTRPSAWDPDMVGYALAEAPKDAKVIFLGDSITARWKHQAQLWSKYMGSFHAADLGVDGSCVGNVLWLIQSGKLDSFNPDTFVLMIGTNDVGADVRHFYQPPRPSAESIVEGIRLIVQNITHRWPNSSVILMGITPRYDGNTSDEIREINRSLASVPGTTFIDLSEQFTRDATSDGLHLNSKGYGLWGRAIAPLLAKEATARDAATSSATTTF